MTIRRLNRAKSERTPKPRDQSGRVQLGWLVSCGLAALLGLGAGVWMMSERARSNSLSGLGDPPQGNGGAIQSPSSPAPNWDALAALKKIQAWREAHPNQHLVVETLGDNHSSTSEFFSWNGRGTNAVWRLETSMDAPLQAHFILHGEGTSMLAFFPETRRQVRMTEAEELIENAFGWSGDLGDEKMEILARGAELREDGELNELRLRVDPKDLDLLKYSFEVEVTLYHDDDGKVQRIVQESGGNTLVSTLRYLSFEPEEIQAAMPDAPDGLGVDAALTFEEALLLEMKDANRKTNQFAL